MNNNNFQNPYADIINMPRHTSVYHRPMSVEARVAQFAPFAALPGHDEIIARRMGGNGVAKGKTHGTGEKASLCRNHNFETTTLRRESIN